MRMAVSADDSLTITAAIGQYNSLLSVQAGQTSTACQPIVPKPTILFTKNTPYNADAQSGHNVQSFDIQGVRALTTDVAAKDNSKKVDKHRKRKRKIKQKKISPLSSRKQKHGQAVLLPAVESRPLYVGLARKPACKTAHERNLTAVVEYFTNGNNRKESMNQGILPADVIMADLVEKSRAEQIKATKDLRTSVLKGTSVFQRDKEVIVKFPLINRQTAVYNMSGTLEEEEEDLRDAKVKGKYKPIVERGQQRRKDKRNGSKPAVVKVVREVELQ